MFYFEGRVLLEPKILFYVSESFHTFHTIFFCFDALSEDPKISFDQKKDKIPLTGKLGDVRCIINLYSEVNDI